MMTRTTCFFLFGVLAAVSAGCDSEVIGGGGGAGGGSGGSGGAPGTTSVTGTTTGGTSSSSSSSDGGSTSVSVVTVGPGSGGGGGGNALGTCEQNGGTAAASSSGSFECGADFTCDGGAASVQCLNDGVTETCDCSLDGAFVGTCVDADQSGCGFPQNCCFDLLGGHAEPNPGPYGACNGTSGAVTSGTGGGAQQCGSYYDCAGGSLEIECSLEAGGSAATCECIDGQGFLLGTCSQSSLDCDYEANCCYDIFN